MIYQQRSSGNHCWMLVAAILQFWSPWKHSSVAHGSPVSRVVLWIPWNQKKNWNPIPYRYAGREAGNVPSCLGRRHRRDTDLRVTIKTLQGNSFVPPGSASTSASAARSNHLGAWAKCYKEVHVIQHRTASAFLPTRRRRRRPRSYQTTGGGGFMPGVEVGKSFIPTRLGRKPT